MLFRVFYMIFRNNFIKIGDISIFHEITRFGFTGIRKAKISGYKTA